MPNKGELIYIMKLLEILQQNLVIPFSDLFVK